MIHNDAERLLTPTQLADTIEHLWSLLARSVDRRQLTPLDLDVIDAVLEGGHRIVGIAGADSVQHRDLGDEMCVPTRAARDRQTADRNGLRAVGRRPLVTV